MDSNELIGYTAAILTTTSFMPQAYKSWKSKDLSGISTTMYSAFTVGVILWLIYGINLKSTPIIVANIFTLIPATIILILKILSKRKL